MTSQRRKSQTVEFEVRCPLSGPALRIIRAFVEAVARQMGFDRESVAQIEMAVDEACSNVWIHAYPELCLDGNGEELDPETIPEHCQVTIRLAVNHHAISISIIDQGVGNVRGPHQGVRTLKEYFDLGGDYHGLGTYIIRSFMDEVEYQYPGEKGTVLHMKKYLRAAQ